MSSLHVPADMPIPELDAIVVQKNKESLIDVEDDMPGKNQDCVLPPQVPIQSLLRCRDASRHVRFMLEEKLGTGQLLVP